MIKDKKIRVRDEPKIEEFLKQKGLIYKTDDQGQILKDKQDFPMIDNQRSSGTAKGARARSQRSSNSSSVIGFSM
jgi:hypothetical protein